jgi:phosphomethylpyrimidine synthase
MNANEKFLAADAHVDEAAIQPLPNSRKIYVEGSRPDIRVPMREISQADTPTAFGGEKNPPIFVYDCSGPYSDPGAKIDIRRPARPARRLDRRARRHRALPDLSPNSAASAPPTRRSTNCASPACTASRCAPRPGKNVSQMHYARQGIITPEMEYVAIRENNNRRSAPASRAKSPPNSCATKSPAAAPSSRPTSTTPKPSR